MDEDTYTTGQVARILRITDRGVRKMIDRGELEAHQDERGRHLILQRAVHALLEDRRASWSESSPTAEISGQDAARSAEEAREPRERAGGPAEGARAPGGPSRAHGEDRKLHAGGARAPGAASRGGAGGAPAGRVPETRIAIRPPKPV